MAQNAENFTPNAVRLDTAHDGTVLRVFVGTQTEPRLVINLDGSIYAGDGVTAPEEVAFNDSSAAQDVADDLAAALTAQDVINDDFEARITALEGA